MKKIYLTPFFLLLFSCGNNSEHLADNMDDAPEPSIETRFLYLSYFNPEPDSLIIEIGDSIFHTIPFEEVSTRSFSYDVSKPLLCRVKNGEQVKYETELKPGKDSDYFLNLGHKYYVEHRFYGGDDTTLVYNKEIDNSKPVIKHRIEVPYGSYLVQTYDYNYVVIDTNEYLIHPYWNKGLSENLGMMEYITDADIPDGYLRKLAWSGDFERKVYADAACPGNFHLIRDMIDFCNIMSSYSETELDNIAAISDSSKLFVSEYQKHKGLFQSIPSIKRGHAAKFKSLGKFELFLYWNATLSAINSANSRMIPEYHKEKISAKLKSVFESLNRESVI